MSADPDFEIGLEATDNASDKVESATDRINKSFRAMKDEQRAVTRQFELQNQRTVAFGRVVGTAASQVRNFIGLYNTWTLISIRQQDANRNVRDSMDDLNEAFVNFGPDSKQYLDALKAKNDALEDLKKAQDDAKIGYALLITSIIADTARLITVVLPKLRILGSVLRATAAAGAASSLIPPVSPAFPGSGGKTPIKTPGGKGSSILRGAGRFLKFGGPIAAGVGLLSMTGEQTAGETDIPMGADAFGDIAKDIHGQINKIYNIIIHVNDPNEVPKKLNNLSTSDQSYN